MKSNIKVGVLSNYLQVIHSYNLLQNVINLLSCYKFRNDARKNIYMIFEDFLKSPEFNTTQIDKIAYLTTEDIEKLTLQ